jgi:replication factor C subunit 1
MQRTLILMDEVDGVGAGDRGGLGALLLILKKTKVPIIMICNDR